MLLHVVAGGHASYKLAKLSEARVSYARGYASDSRQ